MAKKNIDLSIFIGNKEFLLLFDIETKAKQKSELLCMFYKYKKKGYISSLRILKRLFKEAPYLKCFLLKEDKSNFIELQKEAIKIRGCNLFRTITKYGTDLKSFVNNTDFFKLFMLENDFRCFKGLDDVMQLGYFNSLELVKDVFAKKQLTSTRNKSDLCFSFNGNNYEEIREAIQNNIENKSTKRKKRKTKIDNFVKKFELSSDTFNPLIAMLRDHKVTQAQIKEFRLLESNRIDISTNVLNELSSAYGIEKNDFTNYGLVCLQIAERIGLINYEYAVLWSTQGLHYAELALIKALFPNLRTWDKFYIKTNKNNLTINRYDCYNFERI